MSNLIFLYGFVGADKHTHFILAPSPGISKFEQDYYRITCNTVTAAKQYNTNTDHYSFIFNTVMTTKQHNMNAKYNINNINFTT